MKKNFIYFAVLFIVLQFFNACNVLSEQEVTKQSVDFSALLSDRNKGGRTETQFMVDIDTKNGWLVFKDSADFNLALQLVMKNNPDVITRWEKSHTFASLNKLYEVVISEQSTYLKSLKLTEKPSNLPLCEVLKANQDKFIISPKNGIDMKVTVDAMAYLVNVNNLVKVGNQIIQYNYDDIKIIENGDVSKVATLSTTKVTAGNVFVGKVERTSSLINEEVKTKGGRTEFTSVASCDSRDKDRGGSYLHPDAVIAYLEEITYRCTVCPPPPVSIGGYYNTYHAQIKLRSLSNYWPFGWYNYTTYNLHSAGNVAISWQPTGFYEDEITGIRQAYSTPSYSSPVHTRTHTFLYTNLLNTQIPQWDHGFGHHQAKGNYTLGEGFCFCVIW